MEKKLSDIKGKNGRKKGQCIFKKEGKKGKGKKGRGERKEGRKRKRRENYRESLDRLLTFLVSTPVMVR